MTYGYNASFKNFSGHQDLSQIAGKLLAELVDLRKTEAVRVPTSCAEPFRSRFTITNPSSKEKHRPIVFVCHSLGGIVAKKVSMIAELKLFCYD